jgi:flagellar motor switch protein FliN/FliY
MPSETAQIETWLIEEWTSGLASAIGAMAGERPAVSTSPLTVAPDLAQLEQGPAEPGQRVQLWRQPLPPLGGAVWIVTAAGSADALGSYVLRALGVEDAGETERKSTFQEGVNQALAGLAQALGVRLKREVHHAGGSDTRPAEFPEASWTAIDLVLKDQTVTLQFGLEAALTEAIRAAETTGAVHESPAQDVPPGPAAARRSPADNSKTFGLLLEVELPVAVSFGRAQIPLKDVLKLTTGSIVELNRAVTEAVEIIVNNCVIARGEVVVVDGNFGVRIQEVINRQERLRSVQ